MDLENPACLKDEKKNFKEFLNKLRIEGKSPKTVVAYWSDWKHFSRWFQEINEEKFFIKRISTLDVQDYTGHLTQVGASPATINRRLVFLKHS